MPRRVIDLSQPLSRESQLHPFFPPTQIASPQKVSSGIS